MGSTPIETAIWAVSSAGRTPALQAGGHRFDPDTVHHMPVYLSGQKERTCNASRKLHGFKSLSRLHIAVQPGAN